MDVDSITVSLLGNVTSPKLDTLRGACSASLASAVVFSLNAAPRRSILFAKWSCVKLKIDVAGFLFALSSARVGEIQVREKRR